MDEVKPTETVTTIKTESLPRPFWQGVLSDIHVNAAGLTMFVFGALAILIPSHKDQFEELAGLAGTYLFGAAKAKENK